MTVEPDREALLDGIKAAIEDFEFSKAARAKQIAHVIQHAREYRWVGIYEVQGSQIAALGWTGEAAPANPTFAVTQGLNGAAVNTRQPVMVNDVTSDPRYLATFGETKSELIVPVLDADQKVLGTIDVESDRLNAFTREDVLLLQTCARVLAEFFAS